MTQDHIPVTPDEDNAWAELADRLENQRRMAWLKFATAINHPMKENHNA